MQVLTHQPGRYAQFRLENGGRFFLRTSGSRVRIKRMVGGLIPAGLVWEFHLPFEIRRIAPVSTPLGEPATDLMVYILGSISDCQTDADLALTLQGVDRQLREWFAPREAAQSAAVSATEPSVAEVVQAFAAFAKEANAEMQREIDHEKLQQLTTRNPSNDLSSLREMAYDLREILSTSTHLRAESRLPYPKEVIRKSFEQAIEDETDPRVVDAFRGLLLFLDGFVPDNEIPDDPDDLLAYWLKRCGAAPEVFELIKGGEGKPPDKEGE